MLGNMKKGCAGSSPRKARIDLNRFVLRVVGDGMNTFWPWLQRKSWKIMKNYQKWQKMTKTLTFLNMIAAKIMNKYEKIQKMTKTLTFLTMIAAKIMNNDQQWQKHWHFWLWLQRKSWNHGRPDGFGGWDFVRIEIFLCPTCPNKF